MIFPYFKFAQLAIRPNWYDKLGDAIGQSSLFFRDMPVGAASVGGAGELAAKATAKLSTTATATETTAKQQKPESKDE